jgi:hypothetical protein
MFFYFVKARLLLWPMKNKLQKEFNFYIEKQDELVKKFNGKYLLIVGRKIEGAFDSMESRLPFWIDLIFFNFGLFFYFHFIPYKISCL